MFLNVCGIINDGVECHCCRDELAHPDWAGKPAPTYGGKRQ